MFTLIRYLFFFLSSSLRKGGAVVEVPPFENVSITEPEKVCIEIRIGPEKNPQLSDPVEYTYMPEKGSGELIWLVCD